MKTIAESNARNEALERQRPRPHLHGKLNDPSDMWLETKLDDLRDEDGAAGRRQVERPRRRAAGIASALAAPSLQHAIAFGELARCSWWPRRETSWITTTSRRHHAEGGPDSCKTLLVGSYHRSNKPVNQYSGGSPSGITP